MSAATILAQSEGVSEVRRKSLLAESDALLDDVETLRLEDKTHAPPRLREAIHALQLRLGRRNPPMPPATIDAAHDLVFAVQQRLMAANPKHPHPSRHQGRPTGQPIVAVVRARRTWKVLTLPSPSASGGEAEWEEMIESTVERAWDRWCYAQQQAVRAARDHFKAKLAVAVARAAWANYWDLLDEAQGISERLRGPRRARTREAPRT
jgi:hypothetical protein